VLFVIYESLTPGPIDIPVSEGDKIGHILAYASMMLWFAQIYPALPNRCGIACALVLLGIALEFAQRLTPTRTFEIADMFADAIGVGLGWLAAPPRIFNFLQKLEAVLS
jgi:VanZ family protein